MTKFKDEIAASRTFVFVREIEPLLQAGLIKGGDLDNAIVIYEREMSQENYDKLAGELIVDSVSRAGSDDTALDGLAYQGQVTDDIK